MRKIGEITRLQVQRASLKVARDGATFYEPAEIVPVPALWIDDAGASIEQDGAWLLDMHNIRRPDTKYQAKESNSLSINVQGHYDRMRAAYGARITPGCAGENILVDGGALTLDEIAGGLVIETQEGPVALSGVRVAAPCAPFSRWVLQQDAPEAQMLKDTLQHLHQGTRGFYIIGPARRAQLRLGDVVWG